MCFNIVSLTVELESTPLNKMLDPHTVKKCSGYSMRYEK